MSNTEKKVVVVGKMHDEGEADDTSTSMTEQQQRLATHHHHRHHHHHDNEEEDGCCHHHSDHSDDEKDTEPGVSDPINEYDPEIDYIDLTNDRLQDIGNISKCSKLTEIVLRQNKLDNHILAQLNGNPSLIRIDLYENRLTPIPRGELPLVNLTNLEDLDLSFNELRFTRGLKGLPALKKLYLIENKISTIGLDINEVSDQIEMLELGSNRLRVIDNLNNFPQLTELFLGRNKIGAIGPNSFANLPKLRILSLQSNRVTVIENMEHVASTLEEFYISHNGLKTLTGLAQCTNLRVLDLAGNFLTTIDVEQIKNMPNLEELWLNDNKIDNLDWLYGIKHLKNLKTLYLERNPCTGDTSIANPQGRAAYVNRVREILPQLEQIDAEYFPK